MNHKEWVSDKEYTITDAADDAPRAPITQWPPPVLSLAGEAQKREIVNALLEFHEKSIQAVFELLTPEEIVEAIENYCKMPKLRAVYRDLQARLPELDLEH
jgi:hypothetical protein